jgi:alcohol dehydrogenase class IV
VGLARATAASVFWRAVMNLGAARVNPLVEGDRHQAYRLARGALLRVADPLDPAPRIELCAAAFLQNRDADDGGALFERHWVVRVVYAFAAALFNLHPHVSQGEANAALTPGVMRRLGSRDPEAMARIARALDAWSDADPLEAAPAKGAAALEEIFQTAGMPVRLSRLNIPRESLPQIVERSLKNFNADPRREFVHERELLLQTIDAAW